MHSVSSLSSSSPSQSLIPSATLSQSNLIDIKDWILSLPIEKTIERLNQDQDHENEHYKDIQITSNTLENFLSIIFTLKTVINLQNHQFNTFLNEDRKEILNQYQRENSHRRGKSRKRKGISPIERNDINNDLDNSNSNNSTMNNDELGLKILIPNKLLNLFFDLVKIK